MKKLSVHELYFEWMCKIVCAHDRFLGVISYDKLLRYLHDIEFTYILPMDENRAVDGEDLRYKFDIHNNQNISELYEGLPASVLEVLVALSIKCEEQLMSDELFGDRTDQWFWAMLTNLGLTKYDDLYFDEEKVFNILQIFMNREYSYDGRGGLFYLPNTQEDLREVDIWMQLCWYLNTILSI